MKKNLLAGLLVSALYLMAINTVAAQSPEQKAAIIKTYDLEAISKLSAELKAKNEANRKRAHELAGIYGWPLVIEDEKRGSIILTGVTEDGNPRYTANRNDGVVGSAHTARVNALRTGGSLGVNLRGQGMTVGMWEVGYPRKAHVELSGRIADGSQTDGGSFQSNQANTVNSRHATHVAGTLIGSGSHTPDARGIAYAANLRAFDAFNDDSEGVQEAAVNAMLVSNHSYGIPWESVQGQPWLPGTYTIESRIWDDITFFTPYWQPVFAAGNDRHRNPATRDDLLGNANSKNPIVVAAVNSLPINGYSGPQSVMITDFSSVGPTNDRRIKPDISAKGYEVLSSTSTNNSNTAHELMDGTSMASPAVAGVLILLQEYFESLNEDQFMRAATIKGLVLNTADETGNFPGPDYRYGWGLINAEKAAQMINVRNQQSIIDELTLTQGQTYTRQITATGTKPLKATISWTDRPGPASSSTNTTPVLVNNLNMRIIKSGEADHLPWRLDSSNLQGPAIRGINNVDNVETIEIPNASGVYTIEITNGGNPLVGGLQNFSLIVDGITNVLGISENELSAKIGIYPNPAKDVINIALDATIDNSNVVIALYDIQGRVISQHNTFVDKIDVSNLSSGIYMLNVSKDGATASKKIIIE